VFRRDLEIGIVQPVSGVLRRLEDKGSALAVEQFRRRRGDFEEGAIWGRPGVEVLHLTSSSV
jgi:hypothetical protein